MSGELQRASFEVAVSKAMANGLTRAEAVLEARSGLQVNRLAGLFASVDFSDEVIDELVSLGKRTDQRDLEAAVSAIMIEVSRLHVGENVIALLGKFCVRERERRLSAEAAERRRKEPQAQTVSFHDWVEQQPDKSKLQPALLRAFRRAQKRKGGSA